MIKPSFFIKLAGRGGTVLSQRFKGFPGIFFLNSYNIYFIPYKVKYYIFGLLKAHIYIGIP